MSNIYQNICSFLIGANHSLYYWYLNQVLLTLKFGRCWLNNKVEIK